MGSKKIKFKVSYKRLFAISTFIFFISYYDPFGLDAVLTKHSNSLFYNVISPWFDKAHDDEITVILLRENELEEGWPASYEYHADVLESILDNQPEAIFIDLLFETTDKKEVDYIKEVLNETNIPVYMAMGRDRNLTNAFFKKLFGFPVDSVNHIKKPDELNNVIPTSVVINSKLGLEYPMTNLADEQLDIALNNSKYSEKLILSLPAQLYCKDKYAGSSISSSADISTMEKKCVQQFINQHDSQNFYITWRDMFSNNVGSPLGSQCLELSSSAFFRLIKLFLLNLSNSFKAIFTYKPTQYKKQSCVPHQTLSVTHLLHDTDRAEVERLIENKYVFYGVILENTNDIISPPTHTALPGIYAHTMALENYLTYQQEMTVDDYHPLGLGFISLKLIWSFIVCLLLAFVNEYFRFFYIKTTHKIKHKKKPKKKTFISKLSRLYIFPLISLTYLAVVVSCISLIAMVIPFEFFNMAPLSGFNFAVAIAFINLPSIVAWWNKKLEKLGLGESFENYNKAGDY